MLARVGQWAGRTSTLTQSDRLDRQLADRDHCTRAIPTGRVNWDGTRCICPSHSGTLRALLDAAGPERYQAVRVVAFRGTLSSLAGRPNPALCAHCSTPADRSDIERFEWWGEPGVSWSVGVDCCPDDPWLEYRWVSFSKYRRWPVAIVRVRCESAGFLDQGPSHGGQNDYRASCGRVYPHGDSSRGDSRRCLRGRRTGL